MALTNAQRQARHRAKRAQVQAAIPVAHVFLTAEILENLPHLPWLHAGQGLPVPGDILVVLRPPPSPEDIS